MTAPTKYRLNVAGIIIDKKGKILICERYDVEGAWQLPQGGVDNGEGLEKAFRREMFEEIGITELEVIGRLDQPIRYDWPESLHSRGFLGQEQYFFLARLHDKSEICLTLCKGDQEFSSAKWVGMAELRDSVSGFKKDAYLKGLSQIVEKFDEVFFVE